MIRALFITAALMVLPAAVEAQVVSRDSVHLRFGWTAGTTAQVETTRRQHTSGVEDTVRGGAQYRMLVQTHPAGLVISYDDFEFPHAIDTVDAAAPGALADRAAAIVPRIVVDSAGRFVNVEDVASVRARLDSLVTMMLEPDAAAAARESLAALVTEESLAGLAAQEWHTIVGRWAGLRFVPGDTLVLGEEAALPLIQGATVTLTMEVITSAHVPCHDSDTSNGCIEIRAMARADPEEVRRILAEFAERVTAVPGVDIVFESFEMANGIVLVTEPATLRPHSVRLERNLTGVFTADGERSEVSQGEIRTFRYTYER
jgi:hypothetical protein